MFQSPTDPRLTNSGDMLTVYEFADPGFVLNTGDILTLPAPGDSQTWNGFEVIVDGRLWRGGFGQASWTIGETKRDFCTAARLQNPNGLRFCESSTGVPQRLQNLGWGSAALGHHDFRSLSGVRG